MEKQEILEALKSDPRLTGLDIQEDTRRNKISVFGFSNTPDWQICKEVLAEMGFQVMAAGASIKFEMPAPETLAEKFAKMTPEEQAAATEEFNRQATGR